MNKKVIIATVVLAVVGIAIFLYFAMWKNVGAPQANTDSSGAIETGTILYTDSGFQPGALKTKVGASLRVVNQSSSPLQFSSDDHPTHLEDTELNMDVIQPGKEEMLTVSKAGTWGYHNHLKPMDGGTIEVE